MSEKEQWYSNKELYEMLRDLKDETQTMIRVAKEYNDLRKTLNDCIRRITTIEERALGRYSAEKAVREWGGWIVALLAFAYTIYKG